VHQRQPPLRPDIEAVWLAALADADVDPGGALLYVLDGPDSQSGCGAWCLARHFTLEPGGEVPELDSLLSEMNNEDCVDAYRIVVWSERTIEGVAALVRHELEHSLQRETHGHRLFDLHAIAEAVICERAGGLPGGGFLYQVIPDEMDANAAAAAFVRQRFGDERINELLRLGDADGAAFRSLVGPPPMETLPERLVQFLATVRDLCEKWADRQSFGFPRLLDLNWSGAGAVWQRLVEDEGLKLPR
jgi:hypothetical protein